MKGVDFTRIPRNGSFPDGLWDEPWIVTQPAPGYDNRTGLWRLRCGMQEEPAPNHRYSGTKRGYALADLPHGVYVARTAHADHMTQYTHYLHWSEQGIETVTAVDARMLLVNYGG